MTDRRAACGLLAVLFAAACAKPATSPGASPAALATAGAAGAAATSAPRVVLPSGAAITVEIAVTDQEKAQGLMFRESMPKDAGMVFPFDGLEIRPFWMKNCHFPLDLVYATRDGTVVDVLRNVPPCAPDPAPCDAVTPKAKADTVLEVNAGVADAHGAVPGARLKWVGIPGR
ncbi:MAG: DUF192 domain-containing protein [Thermoanaerobaculia bacterium]|nr:DUF192 domain-containing protein [Thermoanaerobaculia bacterium]